MEKKYKLQYKGKWMKAKRMLGTYVFELYDNSEDIELMTHAKALAARTLVSKDNGIDINEITIVEI